MKAFNAVEFEKTKRGASSAWRAPLFRLNVSGEERREGCASPKLHASPNFMHVTSYTTFMYVIDFTRALNFGEGQGCLPTA